MTALISSIETISIGSPKTVGPVSLYPIYNHGAAPLTYISARDAIAAGTLLIEEATEETVPTLLFTNTGTIPVLVTDGEIVEGGYQNRTVTVPVLLIPGTTPVPVACVESGRWHGERGRTFGRSTQRLPRNVRRAVVQSVGLTDHGTPRRVNQGEVWSQVDHVLQSRLIDAETNSLLEIGEHAPSEHIDARLTTVDNAVAILRHLRPLPGQTGVVIAIGGRIINAELFDRTETLDTYWDEVLAAIAFDVPSSIDGSRPSISRALRFVRQVLKAGGESNDGIGVGTEFRFNSSRVAAQGLTFENQLVCLSVIAA